MVVGGGGYCGAEVVIGAAVGVWVVCDIVVGVSCLWTK